MAINYTKIFTGIKLESKSSSTSNSLGDIEVLSSNSKLHFNNGVTNSPVVTESHAATLTNKPIVTGKRKLYRDWETQTLS